MNKCPLVMCLTNTVAANFTANVLLAIGAKPAMIEHPEEAAELATVADAVLVNVGTVTAPQAEVMRAAIAVCKAKSIPWVLDPVAADKISYRRELVLEFIARQPTIVRGNREEIAFFADKLANIPAVLATGEVDEITGMNPEFVGTLPHKITGGVAMLQLVTATGCAQGAVCAAMLGRGLSPLAAVESASRLMKTAGERAFAVAQKPGTFQIALLDALYELNHD